MLFLTSSCISQQSIEPYFTIMHVNWGTTLTKSAQVRTTTHWLGSIYFVDVDSTLSLLIGPELPRKGCFNFIVPG